MELASEQAEEKFLQVGRLAGESLLLAGWESKEEAVV
jgi:hypothetical protein